MISNIVVYSFEHNKVIHRLSEESCNFIILAGVAMNKEIYIIEPHPLKENIIFSGDFDGNIILWDIELGIILNIFKEMAMPI